MIYRYEVYVGNKKKFGRVSADTVENAAKSIKQIYELNNIESTIILYEESVEG